MFCCVELVEEVRAVGLVTDGVEVDEGTVVLVDGREVLRVGIREGIQDLDLELVWERQQGWFGHGGIRRL